MEFPAIISGPDISKLIDIMRGNHGLAAFRPLKSALFPISMLRYSTSQAQELWLEIPKNNGRNYAVFGSVNYVLFEKRRPHFDESMSITAVSIDSS